MEEEASRQQRVWNRELTVKKNLSLEIEKHPRDLLRCFMSENGGGGETTDCEDESVLKLNLGLSLGGRFGVDKTPRKLKRSSSVLDTVPFENSTAAEPEKYSVGLARTTSLLAEIEEEWRKRKEIQSLKRRRCEKQSFRTDDQTASFETEKWVTARKSEFLQRHLVSVDSDGGGGGSSSSLSELDNKNQQGSSNTANEDDKGPRGGEDSVAKKGKDMATDLFDMPCVFTKGDGPNGRRVDGILYKYLKGEQVRIMCICHGSFLTPSEFVKHGGGDDVDHPLRHILVNTSSSTF